MKLDASAVRALLTPAMVLDYFEVQRRGRLQWAVRLCPQCGQLKRGSLSIHAETGQWKCFHCASQGGLFDLVAGYAGIDPKKDFQRVLGVAATIAGIPHGVPDADYDRLLKEHRERRAAQSAAEEARRTRMRARMPAVWNVLDRRSVIGERYLRERSIDPQPLFEHDLVRYSPRRPGHEGGDPAVRLYDLATGNMTGIQYRMLRGDAKLLAQPWSQLTSACLLGRLTDLEKTRLAIIVEGLADTLTARLLWPEAAIFGAPGAAQLETIGAAVGEAVARRRGILLIVPDNDPDEADGQAGVGIRYAARAVIAATKAGLELVDRVRKTDECKMQLIDLGFDLADRRHHDLADAWGCSRWRWRWPEDEAAT